MVRYYLLGNEVIYDTLSQVVTYSDFSVTLGGREAAILTLLCQQRNKIVSKEYIFSNVWNTLKVSEASLTKAISNLRKSLSFLKDNLTCEIKTVPKEGYMLILNTSDCSFDDIESINVKNIVSSKIKGKQAISSFKNLFSNIGMTENHYISIRVSRLLLAIFTSSLFGSIITIGIYKYI